MYADLCHHFKPHQRVEQPLPVILRGETLSADLQHYIANFRFPAAVPNESGRQPGKMKEKRNNQK